MTAVYEIDPASRTGDTGNTAAHHHAGHIAYHHGGHAAALSALATGKGWRWMVPS